MKEDTLGLVPDFRLKATNILNLEREQIRSRHILVSVLGLKARDFRSRPVLDPLCFIKKSRSWTRPLVNFLVLVTKYLPRPSLPLTYLT